MKWIKPKVGDLLGPGFVKVKFINHITGSSPEEYISFIGGFDTQRVQQSQYAPYNIPHIIQADLDGEMDSSYPFEVLEYLHVPQMEVLTEENIEKIIEILNEHK